MTRCSRRIGGRRPHTCGHPAVKVYYPETNPTPLCQKCISREVKDYAERYDVPVEDVAA